jgi:tetratricopeptide (TPR) repeat protein
VPDGPVRVLFDQLHELHHRAGWPSLREMAKEVGCSHTTVSVAFSGPAAPRWGLLELIVETLGGDTDRFHELWLAASGVPKSTVPKSTVPKSTVPESSVPAANSHPTTPRQLPADVAGFIGRAGPLADLDRLLDGASANAVVISAVSGTAGVGKTALALHWAHRVAPRFPDGQLYLNLRGYDPDRPVLAAEVLEVFLRALGVDGPAIPQRTDERAALYRTLLASRKMLVLLDNAHSIDQIRDLLPGTPSCLVLITSRETLPALVARHGAVRINLDLLSETESVELLRTLIGARVGAEPDQALVMARRCARLPLALRIAAELAAARPSATLTGLVTELGDESRRLDLLAAGEDDHTAVRTVFSWSCRHLSAEATAAFELLGLHPGHDFDVHATATLVGADPAHADKLLNALARAHLVEERGPGRFGMHDLLRAYAAERSQRHDDRQVALIRLFEHYLRTAATASRDWLDEERPNLVAVANKAFEVSPAHVVRLSAGLAHYLDACGHYRDGLSVHQLALRAARSLGDRPGEADAHNRLGSVYLRIGSYPEALDHHRQALAVHRETGDCAGQGRALHGLGSLSWRLGRYPEASEQLAECLAIRRALGDRDGEGAALYALGTVFHQLGRYPEALDHQQRALAILCETGDQLGESRALNNLSVTLERMGRLADALDHAERAFVVSEAIGNRIGAAVAMTNLGVVLTKLDRHADALSPSSQGIGQLPRGGLPGRRG